MKNTYTYNYSDIKITETSHLINKDGFVQNNFTAKYCSERQLVNKIAEYDLGEGGDRYIKVDGKYIEVLDTQVLDFNNDYSEYETTITFYHK